MTTSRFYLSFAAEGAFRGVPTTLGVLRNRTVSSSAAFGHLGVYGSDAPAVRELMRAEPGLAAPLHPKLPYTGAEIVWAARFESGDFFRLWGIVSVA